jgi:hypothetical protein
MTNLKNTELLLTRLMISVISSTMFDWNINEALFCNKTLWQVNFIVSDIIAFACFE